MSYIEESLSSGEQIVAVFRLHWFSRLPMVLWIILASVLLNAVFARVERAFVTWRPV